MNRKVLAVVLIMCLAIGAVFAEKGDILVGGQLGYGRDSIVYSEKYDSVKNTNILSQNGFYFTATGEYGITDEIYAKAELGLLAGSGSTVTKVNGEKQDLGDIGDFEFPANFLVYLGAEYKFDIKDEIAVLAGAGLDMAFGKFNEAMNDGAFRLGVGLEAAGVYSFNRNLSIKAGARFSILFVDANSDIQDLYEYYDSHFHYGLKIYAGCTYAL